KNIITTLFFTFYMTFNPPYWKKPEKLEFESKVKSLNGENVVLKETYFHPEGGGQPADKGTINGYEVTDVQKIDGEIVHTVPDHELEVGDKVEGDIDGEYRLYCMRSHTGSHIVYGAGREVLGDIGYSGFGISEDKVRIDFKTDAHIDRKKMLKMERLANKVILDARPIGSELMDNEELKRVPDLAYAKEMPDEEKVRVVKIENWDTATCSGTHFQNTIEIGRIKIIGKKKLQEGVTRIEFKVGQNALKDDYREKRNLLRAEKLLETDHENLTKEIRRLMNREEDLDKKVEDLESKLLKSNFEALKRHEADDFDLLIGTVSTDKSDILSKMVKDSIEDGEVITVINESRSLSVVVGSKADSISANEIIQTLSSEFGGGGGGTDEFAQGGGFQSEPKNLIDHLKKNLL
ncbi:MAG: DHHA1 domain-containing protein, partial [Thermoplasmata archaeon]